MERVQRFLGLLILGAIGAWAQQDIFTNITLLRSAAAPVLPAVGWKDLGYGLGFYGSSIVYIQTTGFVPSTVEYSIAGKSGKKVDEVNISVFIAAPGDLAAGRRKLARAVNQWYKSVAKPMPAGLGTAILTGKPFKAAAGGLSVAA